MFGWGATIAIVKSAELEIKDIKWVVVLRRPIIEAWSI